MSQKQRTDRKRPQAPAAKNVPSGNGDGLAATPGTRPGLQERTWLEKLAVRVSRWLGSLQVAVILLLLFAAALMVGVLVEQQYNAKVAGVLVYRAWWFALLLTLLGVNIFFAAVKKWPWKKHQTGFLVTHLGLLTMLAGGVLNAIYGTDAQMQLIDTEDPQLLARSFAPQESNRILFTEVLVVTAKKMNAARGQGHGSTTLASSDFIGGPLPWKLEPGQRTKPQYALRILDWLRNPLPRSWSMNVGDNARLEVLNFYPQSKHDDYSPAKPGQEGVPAFKVQLQSPRFPEPLEDWLAAERKREMSTGRGMPILVEFLGLAPNILLKEFQEPPETADLGKYGVLTILIEGKPHRFPVDKHLNQTVAVGDTGYQLRITGYRPVFRDEDVNQPPENPAVEFDLIAKDGVVGEYYALSRNFLGHLIPQYFFNKTKRKPAREEQAGLKVWYHPPDYRYGREGVRGVLQFVQTDDGRLHYRSFNSKIGGFNFENTGQIKKDPEADYPIWSGMNWKFRVLEQLPNAVPEERYTYREPKQNEKPGDDGTGVLRCRFVVGNRPGQEFWLSQRRATTIAAENDHYQFEFGMKEEPLPFSIKLDRAESTVDPGTQQAATYTSYVQLTDKELGIEGERRIITMNEPLQHRSYNFYQSDYTPLGIFSGGKPVSRSGFTVGYDPGLRLKYIGTCLLPLGVAIMFYMKAYFFKPRGRRETAAA